MSKRKAEQPHPDGEAAPERSIRLHSAAVAADIADEQQQQPTATFTAGTPFRSLATVELQLVMQHCDLNTLLALARCSRFTLSAASHPFAWRALSPLSFPTTVASRLHGSRLLAHCDVALRWMSATKERGQPDVDDAELAAIGSVPRLVELDTHAREVKSAQMQRLLSHPSLAGLTALHTGGGQLDGTCTALLPLHQPRLRTLSVQIDHDSDADPRLLAPLPQLPALTDLSLDASGVGDGVVEMIGRCASLRRLHLGSLQNDVLFAVLTAPARAQLESLSLSGVVVRPPDGAAAAADGAGSSAADVQSWRASFENLQSLRSLSLRDCGHHGVLFAGAAAALASGGALRNLTALCTDTLKVDNEGGSLIPLLAAHCPQLRRLHMFELYCRYRCNPGALAGLPLLSNLSDLRLQCAASRLPNDDELAVGRCASLTRLHLAHMRRRSLHSILRSPQLQRLESLTLGSVQFDDDEEDEEDEAADSDLDWSVCFANLWSLRALSLDECHGGDHLLAGVQAACPSLVRSMRFSHHGFFSVVPALQLLPALLVQLPTLRVELFQEAPLSNGNSWRNAGGLRQLNELYDAWHKLKRKHPKRVTITVLDKEDRDPLGSWRD